MIWRLDLLLMRMLDQFGPVWPVVAVLCLLYVAFGRLARSYVLGMAILLCAMVWYRPLIAIAHVLRWWVFGILAVRGTIYVLRVSETRQSVGRVPRTLVMMGAMALASCFWARSFTFSAVIAATFVCTLVLCYVVAWRLLDSNAFLRSICVGAVAVALLMQGLGCLLGLYAMVTGDSYLVVHTGVFSRFSGLMHNANGNGVFASLLWPIVLASPREYLGKLSWARWLALLALAVCIVFSGSRTAAGVMLMTTLVYGLYRFRAGAALTTGMVGVVGALLLVMTPLEELEGSAIDTVMVRSGTLSDLGGRLERWELGWDTAMEKPLLGHGWGAARTLDDQDVERSLELGRVKAATNLHSTHVSLLVDVGFVGLGIFWLFGAGVVVAGMRILRAPRSPEATVSVLFFASTLGMLADTLVHNGVLSAGSPSALIFWFSTALVVKQSYVLRMTPDDAIETENETVDEQTASASTGALPLAGA